MPSNLYHQALSALSDGEKTGLESFLAWLESHSDNAGQSVLANRLPAPLCGAQWTRAQEGWIENWLRERLSGRDPNFPIDTRAGEDPEAFVVGLLQQAGTAHPAAVAISRAVLRLLDEVRHLVPEKPAWLGPLLRLCQQVRLDLTFSWFREELQAIASDHEASRQRWGDLRTLRDILLAAVMQAPGRPGTPALNAWRLLLKDPDFSSLALAGLGASLEQKLPYLADWWRHCPADRRDRELKYLIYRGLQQEKSIDSVLKQAPSLPADLRQSIDRELVAQGAGPFFRGAHGFPFPREQAAEDRE